MSEYSVGNNTITKGAAAIQRLAMILWGPSGDGKTTIAATSPGNKLILQFDDSGSASIVGLKSKLERDKPNTITALKDDLYILDMSKQNAAYVGKFDQDDPFQIAKFIQEQNISTVIVDSLTSLGNDTLTYAIKFANLNKSTLATPGKQAYGVRLNYLKAFILNLLRLTNKLGVNIIFISHEADKHNEDGEITAITLALGGNLPNETALSVGEVWYFKNGSEGRTVYLTPFGKFKPMKSRMFDVNKDKKFTFKYDVNDPDPKFEIASMFKQWQDGGYEKIEVPK